MKTKTTWLLIAMLSGVLLAAPAQARDEHHGPRWDRHRDYDYRDHGKDYRNHGGDYRDHGWRHHGHHEPHYRVYVQPERHYYYEQRNYYGGHYGDGDGHRHHRHHHGHHDHDAYRILGGAILLNEILHH